MLKGTEVRLQDKGKVAIFQNNLLKNMSILSLKIVRNANRDKLTPMFVLILMLPPERKYLLLTSNFLSQCNGHSWHRKREKRNIFYPLLQYFEPNLDFGGNFHTLMRYSL